MAFKDEWDKAGSETDDVVQEVIDALAEVIRDEDESTTNKLAAARVLLDHYNAKKSNLPPDLNSKQVLEMTDAQLVEVITKRSKGATKR